MNCLKENRPSHRAGLGRTLVAFFAAIALITGSMASGSRTAQAQATLNIDLGTTAANITLIGGSSNDHLSGNGAVNTSSTFPRAHAVAIGDFNHDGFEDVVIGAPDADFAPAAPGTPRANSGAAYIVFGKATFPASTIIDTNQTSAGQPDIRIFGANAGDNLGFAVATGDVNGDGIDDLIIGAPGFDTVTGTAPDTTTHTDIGAVYVLFGGTNLTTPRAIDLSTPNAASVQITGEAAGDLFGSALAVGDVNSGTGDAAAPDLLVGAPGSSGPAPATPRVGGGAVFLFKGGAALANTGATTKAIDLSAATTPAAVRAYGIAGSQFGSSLAIGDVNSAGAADIIVGAPKANRPDAGGPVVETGAVYVIFGGSNIVPAGSDTSVTFDIQATQQSVAIYGASDHDHLGASVATGNDRGDGVIDLVIGAPDADGPDGTREGAGEVYIFGGGDTFSLVPGQPPSARRIDVSLGTVDLTLFGAQEGDHFGSTVAIGQINTTGDTDATADVLIGAPGVSSGKGAVYALFGGSSLFLFAARDLSLGQIDAQVLGQANGDELGWAIAAGDIDHNTGGDLVIGAPFADATVGGTTRTDAGKVYVVLASTNTIPPSNQNPTVTVTSPNGGETLLGGTTVAITWTAADPNGDNTIDHFNIFLSTDSGANFNTKINTAGDVPGTSRSFAWTVPSGVNTTTARIRVIAVDTSGGTGQDDSNANFAITDAGVAVTLTAPNGGEVIKPGQVFNITWTVPAELAAQVKGFDLFLVADGVTTNITPPNAAGPELPAAARTFAWTVPTTACTTNAIVTIRVTSVTNATSTDSSDAPFTIANQGPTVNLADGEAFFSAPNILVLRVTAINGTTVPFASPITVEISSDEAGTTFFQPTKAPVKKNGNKLLLKGTINGQIITDFIPDNAIRILRITTPNCGRTVLRIKRVGNTIVSAPAITGVRPTSIM